MCCSRERDSGCSAGSALGQALRDQGIDELACSDEIGQIELSSTDVLVLCEPGADEVAILEAYIDATARHYVGDVRIHYRTLVLPEPLTEQRASAAARRVVARIRRGFHYVSTAPLLEDLRGRRCFRAALPARPAHVPRVRHRSGSR